MSDPVPYSGSQPRFSPEEQERLRRMFAPTAKKYRASSRLASVVAGVGAVIMVAGILLPKGSIGWIAGAFFVWWLILVVVAITRSELQCPACRGNLVSRDLGSFCPECGAANLNPGGWFQSAHCDACGKSLRRGKTRQDRVRACTHCGLMVDEKGF